MVKSQIYHGGQIYTVDSDRPWAEAMRIENGKIVSIGSDTDILAGNPDAERINLGGRLVMPGIHDAHSHLVKAASRLLGYMCQLDDPQSLDELSAQLQAYWREHADRGWIFGGIYNPFALPRDVLTREWLDLQFPGVPIVLHDYTYHNVMASSSALAAARIDGSTENPAGGTIIKDAATGEPTGVLLETARVLVYEHMPEPAIGETIEILRYAANMCAKYGITYVQYAGAIRQTLEAAKALDDKGELPLTLICHIAWKAPNVAGMDNSIQERLITERKRYESRRVRVDGIKVFLDGTSMAPIFSHVPLDPETDQPVTYNLLLDPEELATKIAEWTRDGMIVKAHCTGSGSARIGLDCYDRTRHIPRRPGQMHDIAHSNYISERDKPRFSELGVVAEMSPAIWHLPEYQKALENAYDFRSLHEHGALMTIGTDWILPPTPNLFPALAGILTHGDESLPLEIAIQLMTLNGAIAVGQQDRWGNLKEGKDATFIILDRNIFESTAEEIAETQVVRTIVQGEVVYNQTEV